MGWSVDDVMPMREWAENLEDFEKDSIEVRPWC